MRMAKERTMIMMTGNQRRRVRGEDEFCIYKGVFGVLGGIASKTTNSSSIGNHLLTRGAIHSRHGVVEMS